MYLGMSSQLKESSKAYITEKYGRQIVVKNFEDKNLTFDSALSDRNINLFVETKQRDFITGENDWALKKDDILIELVQTLPYFQFPHDIKNILNNSNINKFFNSKKINTAIGWFYKCSAHRLIYFRYLDSKLYDVFDIDFHNFKAWVLNNFDKFELQYSKKTTGTINLKVPLNQIPKPFLCYSKYHKKNEAYKNSKSIENNWEVKLNSTLKWTF